MNIHVIIFAFSALLFGYPFWRIGVWLELSVVANALMTVPLFLSQYVARYVLRNRTGVIAYVIRQTADFLFGLAPLVLIQVLIAELLLSIFDWPTKNVALVIFPVTVLLGIWGLRRAWHPQVVTVPLSSDKISTSLRFVQISDVHIGSRTSRFLAQIVQTVNELGPDFLCITGDFIDQPEVSLEKLRSLQRLNCPVYYCIGNHERYEDLDDIIKRLETLGVEVLRNRALVNNQVQVIGIDDHDSSEQVARVLPFIDVREDCYSILLYHRPQGLEAAHEHGIDLKLSGHTHNGQIMPFNLAVKRVFAYTKGRYQLGNTVLYVNEGTGTWGPTLRLGTQSEITLFELSASGKAKSGI